MFVDWIIDIATACDEHGTRHDTTTDMSDGRCFLETHCILWERHQMTQVIASSPSDVSRDGQSVSDSRTVGTRQCDLAAAAASAAICLSFSLHHQRPLWKGAASREHVADPVRRCLQKSVAECHYVGGTRRTTEIFSDSVIRPTATTAAERRSNGSPLPTKLRVIDFD